MHMAQQKQPERRRVARTALKLAATMRDGSRSKVAAKVIDMSTHGCRIECTTMVEDGSWVWLNITGLESQYSRVVWHCNEFIGLEFEKPLAEPVFERLLQGPEELEADTIAELRDIASRTHWLARQAEDEQIALLADLSRKCAVDAIVPGLKRSESSRAR